MIKENRDTARREVSVSRPRTDTPAPLAVCAGRATVTPEALVPAGVSLPDIGRRFSDGDVHSVETAGGGLIRRPPLLK